MSYKICHLNAIVMPSIYFHHKKTNRHDTDTNVNILSPIAYSFV